MRILVTGGAGFIGSALVRALLAGGDGEVLTVDKLTYAGNRENLEAVAASPRHRLTVADIADAPAMQAAIDGFRPDAIMNLAAESHVDRSIDAPLDFIHTNVTGTGVLLRAALRHWEGLAAEARARFRFLQASTVEVFGDLGPEGRFDEQSPYRPSSPYAASKAAADHLALAFHRTFGLPVLLTHSSNNYGPYQFPEKLIPVVVLAALDGRPIPVYGDGTNVRDWIHVDDHVAALRRVLEAGRPGARYLVGARCEWRNIDLVREICRILDEMLPDAPRRPHESLIRFVADRPGHDLRYAIDPSRLERELGWRARTDFADALRATVAWYLAHRDWHRRALARIAAAEPTS